MHNFMYKFSSYYDKNPNIGTSLTAVTLATLEVEKRRRQVLKDDRFYPAGNRLTSK